MPLTTSRPCAILCRVGLLRLSVGVNKRRSALWDLLAVVSIAGRVDAPSGSGCLGQLRVNGEPLLGFGPHLSLPAALAQHLPTLQSLMIMSIAGIAPA